MPKIEVWPNEEEYLSKIPEGMYPYSAYEYGKRLKNLRKEAGYSRERVGEFVGCTQQNIAYIESGRTKNIKKIYIPCFAKLFECSCSYLLGYTNEKCGVYLDPSTVIKLPITAYRIDEIALSLR